MKNSDSNSTYLASIITYVLMLAIYLIISFNPDSRLWGINWWGYFPTWVPLALLITGLILPLILYKFFKLNSNEDIKISDKAGDNKTYLYVSSVIVFVVALSFYFFRVKTHFLGDGFGLLTMLGTNMASYHQLREFGESLLHLWIYNAINIPGEYGALLSYRIISISAGMAFLVTVVIFARKLYAEIIYQILFILSLVSGGYLLLFFGYVENYSLIVYSVALFTLCGILIIKEQISRIFIIPVFLLAVFFHVIGIVLFPAVVYLLMQDSKIGNRISNLKPANWTLILFATGIIASTVFYYLYTNYYFFRFSFVPLIENRFTIENYTMFSIKHILDFINLIILLTPCVIIFVVWLLVSKSFNQFKQRNNIFLIIMSISALGAAFIFDPKLGMPRDWDLLAFTGLPLVVLMFNVICSSKIRIKSKLIILLLMIMLNMLCLIPRIASQVSPEISLAHFKNYINLDKTKNRYVSGFLYDYFLGIGDTTKADELNSLWSTRYPEIKMLEQATSLKAQRKYADAIRLYNKIIRNDPFHFDVYNNLAECFIQTRQFDSAIVLLDIAKGMSPYNPAVWNNIGSAFFYQKKYPIAEKAWLKSTEYDSTNIEPLVGLISLYHSTKDELKYSEFLARTAQRDNAPGQVHLAYGDILVKQRRIDEAMKEYEKAMGKGINPAQIEQRKKRLLKLNQQ